jgi:predicted ATPase
MKFDLKNIGSIKEASIKVNGLTVIAGENNIGKSAIGKAIFCLMKNGISTTEELYYLIQSVFNGEINNKNNHAAAQGFSSKVVKFLTSQFTPVYPSLPRELGENSGRTRGELGENSGRTRG